jgi:hypothetical protein
MKIGGMDFPHTLDKALMNQFISFDEVKKRNELKK